MAIKARAQQNLTKVFDGSGVFSIILTNENTSIPISNQGLALNYTATHSDIYVYSGTSLLKPVASNPEPGEYTITASGENITAGVISYSGNHASIGNASDFVTDKQTYSITFTASGKDFLGNSFTSQKKQVITALRHGDDATSYWMNTTASVVMKDVNEVLQPSTVMASAVSQEGFANATPYKGIFKIYIKTGVAFPTNPDYTSTAPEVSHTINLDTTMNDIRIDMYSADGSSLLDTQTVPVIAQANGVVSTSIQYTVTDTNVQPTESASWSDTVPTVGIGQFLWTKTTFYYTDGSNAVAYSMGHVGKDGASAPLLFLSSDSQAFTFDGAGNPSPVNQTITFVANLQNLTGTATFVATPYLDGAAGTPIALGGTGNMRTLSVAQFGQVYDSVSVKASLGNLSDTETVYKLKDGAQGAQGVPGPKGPDGLTTYVHIAYANSADGSSNFSTIDPINKAYIGVYTDTSVPDSTDYTKYTWSLVKGADGAPGPTGATGATGPKGADGLTTYVHVAYANSADGSVNFSTTDPTGNAYIGVLTDTSVPDSTDYTKYTWSLVKGADGANGAQGIPGPKGADGLTTYVHFVYAGSLDGRTNFSTTDPTGRPYLGVMTDTTPADSTDPMKYTWSLIQGPQGPIGDTGAVGPKGADGLTTYVHVAYANSSDGSTVFSTTDPTGRAYIGVMTDTSVPDSTDPTKYTWSLIKGADGANGAQGVPGPKGADGLTTYVHFAYANSSDGRNNFSVTDPTGKEYVGTLTDTVVADSTDPTKYTWSLIRGERGKQVFKSSYEDAPSSSGYYWSDLSPVVSVDNPPKIGDTVITPSGNIFQIATVNVGGGGGGGTFGVGDVLGNIKGPQGIPGPTGPNGVSTYVHFAYANSSEGTVGFSTMANNQTYIGVYTDSTQTGSTAPSRYTWSLMKGADGKNAITGWLTNESITLQADSNGNVPSYTSATGSFVVYNGTNQVTGLTVNQANAVGMTLNISGMNYSVTNMVADIAYADLSITYSGTTITKRLTLAKSKAGANGANGTSVVNSTTPPSNPTAGQWWNDMSVTPNMLKVYQSGNWIPYRIDAINLVAQSVTTDKLASNVLVASNVTYTNKNGTSTNLQTFDFDGIKTLLTDGKGNTYSSMDNAVSSTQTWTSIQKQVNNLGQVNQLFNTEFSPDFAGWMNGNIAPFVVDGSYNGSARLRNTATVGGNRLHSELISVQGVSVVSTSVYNDSWSFVRGYDQNKKLIGELKANSVSGQNLNVMNGISIPSTVYYIDFGLQSGVNAYISQPMLVFSDSVGAYVPGQYNNNARVLAIEQSANQFQVKISGDVKSAQNTADSASSKIDNLQVGGRNSYLNSRGLADGYGTNGDVTVTVEPFDSTTNMWHIVVAQGSGTGVGIYLWGYGDGKISNNSDWSYSADVKGTGKVVQFGIEQSDKNPVKGSIGSEWSRISQTGHVGEPNVKTIIMYFDTTDSPLDVYIKLPKLETGTIPTAWTPAPEDTDSATAKAQSTADEAKSGVSDLVDKTQWKSITTDSMDTLTSQGRYFVTGGNTANVPIQPWFYLTVDTPRNDRVTQTVWKDSNSNLTYKRSLFETTWSAWHQVVSSETLLSIFNDSWSLGTSTNDGITKQLITGINGQPDGTLTLHGKSLILDSDTVIGNNFIIGSANIGSLDARKITTGQLSGPSLNIDLDQGNVLFQKGRLYDSKTQIDVNIDQAYIRTTNGGGSATLQNGRLLLTGPVYDNGQTIDSNPYFSISASLLPTFYNQPSGAVGSLLQSKDFSEISISGHGGVGFLASIAAERAAGISISAVTGTYIAGNDRGVTLSGGKDIGGMTFAESPNFVVGYDDSKGVDGKDVGGNSILARANNFVVAANNFSIDKNGNGKVSNGFFARNIGTNGYHTITSQDNGRIYFSGGDSNLIDISVKTVSQSSLVSLKENIRDIDPAYALGEVLKSDVKQYNFIGESKDNIRVSPMIDDVNHELYIPKDWLAEDGKSVENYTITGYLIQSIKALQQEIKELKQG